jgi:RNA polymerase sigma factor (sigma-70 family)
LIRRYERLIYSIPVAYRVPSEQADEIFQRVSVKLFEKLHQIKRSESLPAWLMTTTRRECQAVLVSERRWAPIPEQESSALSDDPPDMARRLDAVRSEQLLTLAFDRLDETCRKLLGALYLEDREPSYRELAKRLGRPVGSLGPTRARCLDKLRKLSFRENSDGQT